LAGVLELNGATLFGGNMLGRVALVTGLLEMMSNQWPACTGVIELRLRRDPLYELHVDTVVLGMARAAGLAAISLANDSGMEATPGSYSGGYLFMTIETFERCRTAAELVA
jgi:hypothetical protein